MTNEEEIAELKARLSLQEWALKVLTHYMRHDPGWEARVSQYISNHTQSTARNTGISEEDRQIGRARLAELQSILAPHRVD